MTTQPTTDDLALAAEFDGCLATAVRLVDRVIASTFDEGLRDLGLRSTQVTLLVYLAALGWPTQSELAEATMTDQTTLSRNLERLADRGLVRREADADDQRVVRYALSAGGRTVLGDALPHWRRAQRTIAARLGEDLSAALRSAAGALNTT
ncbi:MAG: MarR family winged helix-turn-helix transcriptional regulator [Planctomycetota bacterium]